MPGLGPAGSAHGDTLSRGEALASTGAVRLVLDRGSRLRSRLVAMMYLLRAGLRRFSEDGRGLGPAGGRWGLGPGHTSEYRLDWCWLLLPSCAGVFVDFGSVVLKGSESATCIAIYRHVFEE